MHFLSEKLRIIENRSFGVYSLKEQLLKFFVYILVGLLIFAVEFYKYFIYSENYSLFKILFYFIFINKTVWVEVRGQFCGVSSYPPPLGEFWGLNSGCQV